MQRISNILIILFVALSLTAQNQDKKEQLTIQAVTKAKDYKDIENIIDIVQKYKDIYSYIPSIHPIAPKSKPAITSSFGSRFHPIDRKYSFHSGIDFIAEYATTIHATAKGRAIFVGVKGGYGKCIIIEHKYGFKTLYGHLTEYYIQEGESTEKGQIIAFLGNTGKSTGAHLHYEIIKNNLKINPIKFF